MASDYCWGEEMTKALARHQLGEARVIPVILRPCRWQKTPLGNLQAVPRDGKPVSEWPNHDVAFEQIAIAIERTIADLQQQRRRAGEQAQQGTQEARKQAEAMARQAIEEQQRDAQWREQDEARRAAEAEAAPSVYSNDIFRDLFRDRGKEKAGRPVAYSNDIFRDLFRDRGKEKAGRPVAKLISDLDAFHDIAPWCPEMVALPVGEFLMGSPEEVGRFDHEGPQHRVTIRHRFAIGRYQVTFDEYEHFCTVTKREKPGDKGWGRGRRPAIKISWRDAVDYCAWLTSETGKPYRLPSEAEWEYAARAGTTTRYAVGDAITPKDANYSESKLSKTTEVGSYRSNFWGLYDMHGNVWDWVQDIWHDSYKGAPTYGNAWVDSEGENSSRVRVVRGGSWNSSPGASVQQSASGTDLTPSTIMWGSALPVSLEKFPRTQKFLRDDSFISTVRDVWPEFYPNKAPGKRA